MVPAVEFSSATSVHPDNVAPAVLRLVNTLIVVGRDPQATVDAFARGRGEAAVGLPEHGEDHRLAWLVRVGSSPVRFRVSEPEVDRRRHQRKYSEGELGEDISFYRL
jgi:hypothetical protein